VYEGKNPDTGLPIIKAFLNPLVMWIWVGLAVTVVGTLIALVPSLTPARIVVTMPASPDHLSGAGAVGVTGGGD